MSGSEPTRSTSQKTLAERIWPNLIRFWIAGVFLVFLIVRVAGSNTAKHILHWLGLH